MVSVIYPAFLNNNPHVKYAFFRLPHKDLYFSPQEVCENWQPHLIISLITPKRSQHVFSLINYLEPYLLFLSFLYNPLPLLYLTLLCLQKILSPRNAYFHIYILSSRVFQKSSALTSPSNSP